MRLNESRWIAGGGLTAEWRGVHRLRLDEARRGLREALGRLSRAPAAVRRRGYAPALRFVLGARGQAVDRLMGHPCLDYWLYLGHTHFSNPAAEEDWRLHYGLFGGFAAALAVEERRALSCEATLDPDGRLYLYGTPWFFEFAGHGKDAVALAAGRGALRVSGDGIAAECSGPAPRPAGPLHRLEAVTPGVVVDDRGWLQLRGVTMHGVDRLEEKARRRFADVLRSALADVARGDAALHAEMRDLLRVVVPLRTSPEHASVSSSYVNLRGLVALSYSDDPVLQAETLIHEFCHMKMNQLLVADPVLAPGQAEQVYYSPWRPDARRLRGLLLGAHAFLNVARYLAGSIERGSSAPRRREDMITNVARRVFQVESALRSLSERAAFTEFGRRFLLGLWRELGLLRQQLLRFPPGLVAAERAQAEAHRRQYALADTPLHKDAAPAAS